MDVPFRVVVVAGFCQPSYPPLPLRGGLVVVLVVVVPRPGVFRVKERLLPLLLQQDSKPVFVYEDRRQGVGVGSPGRTRLPHVRDLPDHR